MSAHIISSHDLDAAATTVAATPAEASIGLSHQAKSHFNASLDKALSILKQQDSTAREGSTTPVNWSSADTEAGSVASAATPLNTYSAPDDLILEGAPLMKQSASSRSSLSVASTMAYAAAQGTSVVAHKESKEDVRVECKVRARIPYPGGHFYLHLFHNSEDNKEHLAIVFGDDIRSASLESIQDGESEMDRKIRGASTGAEQRAINEAIARRNTAGASEPLQHPGFEPDAEDAFGSSRVPIVDAPLVRIHSECFTGETVSSVRCDCGYQLAEAMRLIQHEGRGAIVYLRQEGRGIGLMEKLKAYNLQDMGHDTVDANLLLNHPADARTYGSARAILADLGISKLRLLTNNTDKIRQLRGDKSDLDIVCHVPMYPRWWDEDVEDESSYSRHLALKKDVMREADRYLKTKAERMGHMLSLERHHAAHQTG